MQIAKHRLQPHYAFAIEHDIHAENAVGGGMMRPHRDFKQLAVAIRLDDRRPVPALELFASLTVQASSWLHPPRRATADLWPVAFEHFIVRGGLVFVIVGLDVILAHRVVLEPSHIKMPPQIGVARRK